jgi:hypothetical protein
VYLDGRDYFLDTKISTTDGGYIHREVQMIEIH